MLRGDEGVGSHPHPPYPGPRWALCLFVDLARDMLTPAAEGGVLCSARMEPHTSHNGSEEDCWERCVLVETGASPTTFILAVCVRVGGGEGFDFTAGIFPPDLIETV